MPYTRAYRLPQPEKAAEAVEKETPLLNVTPSSNWIQETFNSRDRVEEEGFGSVIVIRKATRSSLYQRLIDMQTRARLFRLKLIAADPVPNAKTLSKLTEEAKGDLVLLDRLIKEWESSIIDKYTQVDPSRLVVDVSEDTVLLDADGVLQNEEIDRIRLTISSPELPTRGDLPITAIYLTVDSAESRDTTYPFTWTDRSGFISTVSILPNVIYEIQPVSIVPLAQLTLLA